MKGRKSSMSLESSFPSPSPTQSLSSDKLRNIYHELGRRQSDIHALSLALSQTTNEKKILSEEISKIKSSFQLQIKEITNLKEENERLMNLTLQDANDKSKLLLSSFLELSKYFLATIKEQNSNLEFVSNLVLRQV